MTIIVDDYQRIDKDSFILFNVWDDDVTMDPRQVWFRGMFRKEDADNFEKKLKIRE